MASGRVFVWEDPTTPLTIRTDAGRRPVLDIKDSDGHRPFGFAVEYGDGVLTVRWAGLLLSGDDLVQTTRPAPAGPLTVEVLG